MSTQLENALEVEILKDEVEMRVPITIAMLLTEARMRGHLRIKVGNQIYTITCQNDE